MVVEVVEQALRGFQPHGGKLLLAVSGGIDSVALLHASLEVASRVGVDVSVGHIDHGLRGDESDLDAAFVAKLASELGVPAFCRRVNPAALRENVSSRSRPTLQEAARAERYAALYEMAREADCAQIATAHTLDDQAETVLLRLFRGTGPDGLAGIPDRSPDGVVIRPLLRACRAQIESYASQRHLCWREDSSNASPSYSRNRLRSRWIPGLSADFNPQLLRAISNLADAQKRDSEWIESLVAQQAADRFAEEDGWMTIRGDDWRDLPEALAARLMLRILKQCGGARDASRVHVARMLNFVRFGTNGTHIELPGGVQMVRDREGIRIGPLAPRQTPENGPGGGVLSAC
jgi:tRNA(Ile)-lysidine synthase